MKTEAPPETTTADYAVSSHLSNTVKAFLKPLIVPCSGLGTFQVAENEVIRE
jgi:hypothetical protein